MSIKPVFEYRHWAGRRRGGRNKGGELGEDGVPVRLGPIWSRVRGAELGRAERYDDGDMVGASRLKRCIPPADSGGEKGVREGQVEDRGPGRVCEREVGIHPGLVKKGKTSFRREGKIRVRDVHLSRVVDPERVGGGVVDVEVSQYEKGKRKNRKTIKGGEGTVRWGPQMGAVRIRNAKPGEGKIKQTRRRENI